MCRNLCNTSIRLDGHFIVKPPKKLIHVYIYIQISVLAQDQGVPNVQVGSPARVVVNVIRNKQAPKFRGTYSKNLTETKETNVDVVTVFAEDGDSAVRFKL